MMLPRPLHHGREQNERPLVLVIKELLEFVPEGLQLQLVLHQALKVDALHEVVLVRPRWLGVN